MTLKFLDSAECLFMVADVPAFVSHPPFYRQYLSHGGSFCDICVISDDFWCNNSLLYILHIGQCQMFVRHRFCPHNNWDGRYPPGRLSYHIPGWFREFQRNTRRGDFPHRSWPIHANTKETPQETMFIFRLCFLSRSMVLHVMPKCRTTKSTPSFACRRTTSMKSSAVSVARSRWYSHKLQISEADSDKVLRPILYRWLDRW